MIEKFVIPNLADGGIHSYRGWELSETRTLGTRGDDSPQTWKLRGWKKTASKQGWHISHSTWLGIKRLIDDEENKNGST